MPARRDSRSAYDGFADCYDAWARSAGPLIDANQRFYADLYCATDGPVVELGVGNGRIAIEAARRGKALVGIDASAAMLETCRQRAAEAGVLDRLRLVQADFRDFALDEPAELVAIPFHSIGHMVTPEDKRACLRHVRDELAPTGRLVFDHFVFDRDFAAAHQDALHLRAEFVHPRSGRPALLWAATRFDFGSARMTIHVISEELDEEGVVVRRRVQRIPFSWIEPDEAREMLVECGYEVEALFGDFDRAPFRAGRGGREGDEGRTGSRHQIWVALRR